MQESAHKRRRRRRRRRGGSGSGDGAPIANEILSSSCNTTTGPLVLRLSRKWLSVVVASSARSASFFGSAIALCAVADAAADAAAPGGTGRARGRGFLGPANYLLVGTRPGAPHGGRTSE